jgi:hypothetical protein
MQGNHSLENALVQAKEKEKEYEWLFASKFYAKALADALAKEDAPAAGKFKRRLGSASKTRPCRLKTAKNSDKSAVFD